MSSHLHRVALAGAALAALLVGTPAVAGGNGKAKGRQAESKSTQSEGEISTAAYTSSDRTLGGINPTSTPMVGSDFFAAADAQAALRAQIRADQAHQVASGHGMIVAVLDGGFNLDHPALQDRLMPYSWDTIDHDADAHDTGNGVDDNGDGVVDGAVGHGTFVAGMVLVAAPDARILPVRVRNDEGFGPNIAISEGIYWAVDQGAHVINLSLATGYNEMGGLGGALSYAMDRGVIVVAAAGNTGATFLSDMASTKKVLAVGAVDADDQIAPFSNYVTSNKAGYRILFAPGVDLVGPTGTTDGDEWGVWSGTSFSAGLVSGACALAKQLHGDWMHGRVLDHVEASVDSITDPNGRNYRHGGRINLWKVVSE